jgi:hypothetical protein
LLEKTNRAGGSASMTISDGGPDSIVVSGGVSSSILHSQTAGTGSASRFCTRPCTSKVWVPATAPLAAATWASV